MNLAAITIQYQPSETLMSLDLFLFILFLWDGKFWDGICKWWIGFWSDLIMTGLIAEIGNILLFILYFLPGEWFLFEHNDQRRQDNLSGSPISAEQQIEYCPLSYYNSSLKWSMLVMGLSYNQKSNTQTTGIDPFPLKQKITAIGNCIFSFNGKSFCNISLMKINTKFSSSFSWFTLIRFLT